MAIAEKKGYFNEGVHEDTLQRIHKLSAETKPLWGTMTAAQMFAHCAEVTEVLNGKDLKSTPFFIKMIGGLVKKVVLSDKPYPRNSGTHPQYKQTEARDFETEKKRLIESLEEAARSPDREVEHALFGTLTPVERGFALYKHLDHHLTQFGV